MTGSLCHRVGPGRLPYTDRRDVGGGVAMAATALLAAALWVAVLTALWLVAPDSAGVGLVLGFGLFSPLAVLGALLVGTALWRYWVPAHPDPVRGGVAGGLTVLASLVPVAIAFGGLLAATNLDAVTLAAAVGALVDFGMGATIAYFGATVLTGWLAVPLGLFGGWYHERARRDRDTDPGAATV